MYVSWSVMVWGEKPGKERGGGGGGGGGVEGGGFL